MSDSDSVLHNLPEPTDHIEYYADRQGRILSASVSLYAFLEKDSTEVLGKTYAELLPAALAQEMLAHDALALESEQATTATVHLPGAGGTQRAFEIQRGVWWAPDGTIYGVICRGRDVTTELALKKELEQAREQIAGSPEPQPDAELTEALQAAQEQHEQAETQLAAADAKVRELRTELDRIKRESHATLAITSAELQEALRRHEGSEARFRALFENSPLGVAVADFETLELVHVNEALCEMLGYDDFELIGLTVPELTHPADLQQDADARKDLSEGERARISSEKRLIHKDGDPIWVRTFGAFLPQAPGEPRRAIATIEDITEHRRAVDALRESEQRFRAVVDRSPDGLLLVQNGRIQFANPAAQHLFGLQEACKLIGEDLTAFVPEAERVRITEVLDGVKAGSELADFEQTILRADGSTFPAEWNGIRIHSEGQPAVQLTIRDITARKQAETAMIQAERLSAVGTLVRGVAHQFNNINAAIVGYAEILRRDAALPERLHRPAQRIIDAVLRSGEITESLLKFSEPPGVERHPTSLQTVVREALSMVSEEFGSEGIEIELLLRPTPCTPMHPSEIGQVVLHFLINAQHALHQRPVRRITIETGEQDERVYVSITDTGCGIPAHNLPLIFSPFFTTKGEFAERGSNQDQFRGAGLGLSVCHTITERHEGEITVDSKVDAGSTFTLWLPLMASPSSAPTTPTLTASQEGGRVLLVDDDPSIGELLEQLLGEIGYDMKWLKDGAEALDELRARSYDVALIDLQMPGMNGEELVGHLSQLPPANRPIPILITGRTDKLNPDLRRAVFDTVRKPFSLDQLSERIKAAVSLRQWSQNT